MFDSLTEKFRNLFSSLAREKVLTEENISEATREVRLALLEADVNFTVANLLVQRIKEKALGVAVLKSVSPGEQFTKIVHDELVQLMGGSDEVLDLKGKLSTIMLCGLQGSGKTTTCAKLAAYLKSSEVHRKILMVACDLQRPAAITQLQKLGQLIGIDVFHLEGEMNPLEVAKKAKEKALKENYDTLIVDTAGRLHVDEDLMQELASLKTLLEPKEVLFVANATTGQDAVRIASEFDQRVQITGSILTMLDGSARAGAAISIREITKKPLKFEGVGEKVSDFQLFHPRSMADRILGMGDVINLVKKAEQHFDEKSTLEMEQKLRKASFTYEDYLKQMGMVKKMGSLKSLLKMIPGMGSFGDLDVSDQQFKQMEAMILSMTPRERVEKDELTHQRKSRIARGSGVPIDEVNRMLKGFKRVKQLFKNMPDMKAKMKGFVGMSGFEKNQRKDNQWR